MNRLFRALASSLALALLSAFLAIPTTGCAALGSALPSIITAVVDGAQILDAIESFVSTYFLSHPDAEAQKKIGEALTKCRVALNVALRTAQGSKELNDAQVDAAFDSFKAAYLELIAITQPYGVRAAGDRLYAAPGGLNVPEPLAFHPYRGRQ